jgi:ribonuclease Z
VIALGNYRDYYFPNTEPLAADEMRVIALGTGRPFVRRAQANTSWLVELGNTDKFVFDFGSGSQTNFTALEIPHQDITAYFATHLHTDHVGDFAQVWIGSWTGGRVKPLVVYGPSGPEPKYGIEHFVRRQMESFAWDTDTRLGLLPDVGAEVEVHEFDYRQVATVYDQRGVVIKAFPRFISTTA